MDHYTRGIILKVFTNENYSKKGFEKYYLFPNLLPNQLNFEM